MWFLIRTGFWLSLALMILPLGTADKDGSAPDTGLFEAVSAVRSAVSDLSGFCARRGDTCETGRKVAGEVASRARQAAGIAYLYLDDSAPARPDTGLETGSVK